MKNPKKQLFFNHLKTKKMSKEMTVQVTKKEVIITLPLTKGVVSKSGKSMVVAGTGGNVTTEAKLNGKNLVVGCNVYYSVKDED